MGNGDSKPAPPNPELDRPWREFDFGQKETLKEKLQNFSTSSEVVTDIKILVAGEIGAGKSSFINSVDSAFQGRITSRALANSSAVGHSFTQILKPYTIRSGKQPLPFVFKDIMGLEAEAMLGSQPDDIINIVFGHVKDGYKFNEKQALTHKDQDYISDPNLSDQAFCLVYVIPADLIQFTDDKLIDKLRIIRQRISDEGGKNPDTIMPSVNRACYKAQLFCLIIYMTRKMYVGIPQVIVMTKVDEACPLVKENLRKIYTSKKIKEKMELCSAKTGVPLTNIFPVKNYHNEGETKGDIDALILKALEKIVQIADDRLLDIQS